MKRQLFLASGGAAVTALGLRARAEARPKSTSIFLQPSLRDKLASRAERTGYKETSSYQDVLDMLDALDARGAPIFRGSLGKTAEGRDIPYVVASRPRITSPREARDSGRAIVYVQATLDGGQVDGKEALLAMLRDLCVATEKTLLDDLVLVIVPIANPDGHERLGPASVNRPEQNGPAQVGVRANGTGLDLDRDYVKAETAETRGVLALVEAWNPDVFVDCHTTDGSYSGYDVTYTPSLHPAAFAGGPYARDVIFPAVHDELTNKFGLSSFSAGNFGRTSTLTVPPAASNAREYGWFASDYRPRIAANYFGLRGRIAISANSYAHDTFEERTFATRAFVESVLGFVSTHDDEIIRISQLGDNFVGGAVPIRASLSGSTRSATVQWELLGSDPGGGEPGLPPGLKRSGQYSTALMPIYDRFGGTTFAVSRGYFIPYKYTLFLLPLLKAHGIIYDQLVDPIKLQVRSFTIDGVSRASVSEERRRETTLSGRWSEEAETTTRFGDVRVPIQQTLGPLAACLLEPEAADGFATWGLLDAILATGQN